jgi:hypothetical protein
VSGWERSTPAAWIAAEGSAGGVGSEKMEAMEEDPERARWRGSRAERRPARSMAAAAARQQEENEDEGAWKWVVGFCQAYLGLGWLLGPITIY